MDDLEFGQTIRGFVEGQKVLGRYTLKHILGRGGMGVVWLAWDEKLERDVALKFLPEMVRLDAGATDELKRETRKNLELTHANIVRIYDFVEDGASAAIAMEYVDGDTLTAWRVQRPNRIFEPADLMPWARQVCAALEYAHTDARIVHRDLKPSNLMLDQRGRLKVTDFGIARSISDSISRLTVQPSGSSGTLAYMSPQQARGVAASPLDDVYSLGATFYELLTSKPPFYSGAIYQQVLHEPPVPVSQRRTDLGIAGQPIPAAWEETILACLAKDPAQRPQSISEVWDRLNQGPAPAAPEPVTPVKIPKSKMAPALIAGFLALLVVGGAGGWWYGVEQPRQEAVRKEAAAQHQKDLADAKAKADEAERKQVAAEAEKKRIEDEAKELARIAEAQRQKELADAKAKADAEAKKNPFNASKENPWENSLGMKFVPVAVYKGKGSSEVVRTVLMSQWETRVKDYQAFCDATGRIWEKPKFAQAGDHPAVMVSWEDGQGFCEWLSKKEGKKYRLPTDHEWSCAVGIGNREDPAVSPRGKDMKIPAEYPWGSQWPPPNDAGNYLGEEVKTVAGQAKLKAAGYDGSSWSVIEGFNDGQVITSAVGMFRANKLGLYDMGGNVWEWCEDRWDPAKEYRLLRGASWSNGDRGNLLSSRRYYFPPASRVGYRGFRVVCEGR